MIIDRFGNTYATAYELPRRMMRDDFNARREPIAQPIALTGGAFDFFGDEANPIAPLTIRKSGLIVPSLLTSFTGTGDIGLTAGNPIAGGNGTLFLTEVAIGDAVVIDGNIYTVTAIASNTSMTILPPALTNTSIRVSFTVRPQSIRWSQLDTSLESLRAATIAVGERRLWGLMRDGSKRWAWAKCVGLRAAEAIGQIAHQPVDLDFHLREGVWYSESEQSQGFAGGSPVTTAVTNSGNAPAPVRVEMLGSGSTPVTQIVVSNAANGSGWTWAGAGGFSSPWTLIVNAAAYQALKTSSVNAYADLTITDPFTFWLWLSPGSNSITITHTGTGYGGAMLYWYNTWIM